MYACCFCGGVDGGEGGEGGVLWEAVGDVCGDSGGEKGWGLVHDGDGAAEGGDVEFADGVVV